MPVELLKSVFDWATVVLIALTVVSGAGALITGDIINRRQESRLHQFDQDLTGAKTGLAAQQERAAKAENDTELLKQDNLKLQSELLRLQKQSEARRLTGEQKDKLVKLLSSPPKTEGVAIVSPMTDGEAADFADDFDLAFKVAHWDTVRIKNRITNDFGISVVTAGGVLPARVKRISEALASVGILHDLRTVKDGDASISPAFQSGYLYVLVEHKPLPKADTSLKK